MKHLLSLLLLLLIPTLMRAQTYQEVRVHAAPESIRTIASLGLAVDDGMYRDGIWSTVLTVAEVAKLKNAGFTVDVIREDLTKYIQERNLQMAGEIKEINSRIRTKSMPMTQYPVPVHFELGSMGGYYTPDQVLNELDSMRQYYPNLISVKAQVGTQLTVEGRMMYYVRISNTPDQNTNKKKIIYNGLTHAREPIGMQHLIYFMWYLLENYSTNDQVKYIVDNLELYFIPIMNPDGYAYNYQIAPGGGGLWRKNRRPDGAGNWGIDLNRNFGYMWGYDNQGSSPNPWDETYRGAFAFSEYETQNFRDFCADKKFKMAYNFHAYADQTLYPWCYITQLCPDSLTEYAFTDHMLAKNGYVSGTPGSILYNTNGDINDWEYGDATTKPRIICFTTEIGNNNDGFWPVPNRIIPLCQENMYANLQASLLTLPYAEVTDMGSVINSKRDGWFPFRFQRLGLSDSVDYSVSVKPLDTQLFESVGPAKVIHYPAQHAYINDSVSYSLKPGIQIGQPFRFVWEIDNGLTILRDTVTKYYGWEQVLLADSCSTMDNWTSPKWNISNKTSHSAPYAITDSPNGFYNNSTNYSVTLKNKITLGTSPVTVVQYWVRHSIEKSMDYCQVATSLNNGSQWTKQATRYTDNGSILQDFPNPIYDGNRNWSQDRIVLNTTQGNELLLKFTIRSDGNGVIKDGFYFDDVRISVVDMTYNGIDPTGTLLGFISDAMPNPASNTVSVKYQLPGTNGATGTFQLLDSRGITVRELTVTSAEGKLSLDVSALQSGLYLYRISGSFGSTAVKKLVVAH